MNWQKYLGLAVILLAIYGAGTGTGWMWHSAHVEKGNTEIVRQAGEASNTVLPEHGARLAQLERDKVLLEEALKHASDNDGCIYTRGDISLLNHARTGLPDAAAIADAEARAPAAYSQRQEITDHAHCGTRYRALAARHDALIDWLNLSRTRK